ncbi:MAG: hypothetical protein ACR2HR_03265 [Euzebya sp.]
MLQLDTLPGAALVTRGLADLATGAVTTESLLVSMAATRLADLGLQVPPPLAQPEHRLWQLLADQDVDAAHGRYNALVGQLVSFQRALACVA